MKHWILCLGLALWGTAQAATPPAISLEPPAGQTALNQFTLQTIQGQCGQSQVTLSGIMAINNGVYSAFTDESKLTLTQGNKKAVFGPESGLFDDDNGIACVTTKIGKRLLFWSNCNGNACAGQMSFFVFDPATLKRLITSKPNESCNAACASKMLGGHKLPFQVVN